MKVGGGGLIYSKIVFRDPVTQGYGAKAIKALPRVATTTNR